MDAFLSFTGSTDRRVAQDYLQRGGTVESAVSLFYAEGGSGSGGVAGGTGFAMDDMDAATRAAIEHAMFSEDAVSGTTAVGKLGEVVREFRSASGNVVQIVHGDLTVEGNSASADAAVGGGAAAADAGRRRRCAALRAGGREVEAAAYGASRCNEGEAPRLAQHARQHAATLAHAERGENRRAPRPYDRSLQRRGGGHGGAGPLRSGLRPEQLRAEGGDKLLQVEGRAQRALRCR